MTRRFCLMLLSGAAAAQIVRPRIGYMVDREQCLRAVEGVAGAFVTGPVLKRDVVSAAFSGNTLVLKTANSVRVNDSTFDSPEGPAAVVFDGAGQVAEIFFPNARVLWTWREGGFVSTPAHELVTDVYVRRGELVVDGVPVRLKCEALVVSQLGEGWLVVYAKAATYAIRGSQVFELPEGSAE